LSSKASSLTMVTHSATGQTASHTPQPQQASMFDLPFATQSFDLLWSEGAIYIVGFAEGLKRWKQLLKPGGFIALTDMVWLQQEPPEEIFKYWQQNNPNMPQLAERLAEADRTGYQLIDHFTVSAAAWSEELNRALDLAGDHLSLYQLTIEPGTAFHRRAARGETLTAAEPTAAALYEITQQRLAAAGLPAYEISNHARPGGESRHNLTYWRYQDYVGIGPGAHGRVTIDGAKVAIQRIRRPEDWLDAVEAAGHGEKERIALSAVECLTETVLMGLRLTEGVRWERLEGGPALEAERIADLVAGGFLLSDAAGLRATAAGRQRLDRLILELLS